jgi:hypothetical protein
LRRKKNRNLHFSSILVFIPVFDIAKMKDFQIQHGEVWWGLGDPEIYNVNSLSIYLDLYVNIYTYIIIYVYVLYIHIHLSMYDMYIYTYK